MRSFWFFSIALFISQLLFAQADRWQQHADYKMEVLLNHNNHRYDGNQVLVYTNNSPDTLTRIFYHMYFNAFQPGSMMDVRSRNIVDPDRRVGDRISKLSDSEIGYLKAKMLKQDGEEVVFDLVGTILEVQLNRPILPGSFSTFEMFFEGQVPVQIRRSGRNNAEGIAYSMVQWYPKMCEYDYEGWHANPYIGREFYGIWGDYDVKITMDPSFVIAASGYIQNPEVGHGYEKEGTQIKKTKKLLTWHFVAPMVHDFMWAADPDYKHVTMDGPNQTSLHFFYQPDSVTEQTWPQLPELTSKALAFMNENYGVYPYKKYSVIQGGDGGMEYAMGTLIRGRSSMRGLIGVTVHEFFHSWYQMVLGSNESLHAWMDEGFTSYATAYTMAYLYNSQGDPLAGRYSRYYSTVSKGIEEPLTSHADHFNTNEAYGTAAYSKGAVTLGQLEYIMGKEVFDKAFRRYYNTWKFKHPNPTDFKRVMEKESGLELDWYFLDWVGTTRTIDYGIKSIVENNEKTMITLERIGQMPMPIEVVISYSDDSQEIYYMPLRIMRGTKNDDGSLPRTVLEDWPWTYPTYSFEVDRPSSEIVSIEIDPSRRMADIDQSNNKLLMKDIKPSTFE